MLADGAQANVITYVATLSASSKSWQWQVAMAARGDVQSNELQTSVIPHNVTISVCSKGQSETARPELVRGDLPAPTAHGSLPGKTALGKRGGLRGAVNH